MLRIGTTASGNILPISSPSILFDRPASSRPRSNGTKDGTHVAKAFPIHARIKEIHKAQSLLTHLKWFYIVYRTNFMEIVLNNLLSWFFSVVMLWILTNFIRKTNLTHTIKRIKRCKYISQNTYSSYFSHYFYRNIRYKIFLLNLYNWLTNVIVFSRYHCVEIKGNPIF